MVLILEVYSKLWQGEIPDDEHREDSMTRSEHGGLWQGEEGEGLGAGSKVRMLLPTPRNPVLPFHGLWLWGTEK